MNLTPIPDYIANAFASFVLVFILKKWGEKLNPKNNAFLDRVIDIVTMVAGASVMASLSTTPLIKSFSSLGRALFDAISAATATGVGIGLNIVTLVITGGVTVLLAIRFEKSEKWIDLVWFGLALLAASATFPWINDALSWWATYVVVLIWNLLIVVVKLIFEKVNFNAA